MEHTPEQLAVIESEVGNLLVSAAAGSGKTAVLTDRIVRRIIERQLDIRQVLVMTFTEAAASSMKGKIEEKLRAALAAAKDNADRQHLSRQLSLLPGAAVSTIHAFCLDVIRNFYYCALDEEGQPLVEPGFSVEGGPEADLLLKETLDDWMNHQYESVDRAEDADFAGSAAWRAAFFRLVEGYGSSRGDAQVRALILALHRFLRSLPNYQHFVKEKLALLQAAAGDFSSSHYIVELLRMLRLHLERVLSRIEELQGLLDSGIRFIKDPERNDSYCRQFQAVLQTLRDLASYLGRGGHDWDRIRNMGSSLSGIDLPRGNKADTPEKKAFMDLFCEYAAEAIHFLSGSCGTRKFRQYFIQETQYLFGLSASQIEADISDMLPAVQLLFDLVLGLDRAYAARKRAAGTIDFSDFEHMALAILQQDEPRRYYRQHFLEIYVDEYQDTSSIQEAIIQTVSDCNCLMVGDVKQSIYRFRHARPQIFMEKAKAYLNGSEGLLYGLSRNFRSVAGILAAANDLFSRLMAAGSREIEYDESQALKYFRPDDPAGSAPVHLLLLNRQPTGETSPDPAEEPASDLLDTPADGEEIDPVQQEETSRDQQEALLIVRQMYLLREQGQVWEDMVVLCRTRATGLVIQQQLENYGIPATTSTAESFLDTPVLRQMEALVHLIDNVRQDIPLAAVMRSTLYRGGFSLEDLARIRLHARQNGLDSRYYHEAVFRYAETGEDPDLRGRVGDFLEWIDRLRDQEQTLALGELIGLVYAETGWLDRVAAQPDGNRQVRQLRQFQQWTEQFESRRQRGLYAFARYLESLRSRDGIESPFPQEVAARDVVRIMTIHGSKGLEFPIVFLAGTGYRITPRDSGDRLLISEKLGIGMDFADPDNQVRYPTHLKLAMLEEIKASVLAEELRLLYVAVTRAKDKLYITGTVQLRRGLGDTRLQGVLQQSRQCAGTKLPDYLVLSGRNYLEWLLMALSCQPGLDWSWLGSGVLPAAALSCSTVWGLEVHQLDAIRQDLADLTAWHSHPESSRDSAPAADPAALIQAALADPGQFNLLKESSQPTWLTIAAPYRFEQAAHLPVKLAVSELKRREQLAASQIPENGEHKLLFFQQEGTSVNPRGIGLTLHGMEQTAAEPDSGLSSSEFGTLLHAVFRYMDIEAASRQPDPAEINRQLDAMVLAGMISEAEKAAIKPLMPNLIAFASSSLVREMAQALADPHQPIFREIPFTLTLPACQVYANCGSLAPEDRVLVQGIIDCWYETEEGVTLVDYKSDRLSGSPDSCQAELQNRYQSQLDYYAQAIKAATGKSVSRRLIWLIRQGRAYELDNWEAGS